MWKTCIFMNLTSVTQARWPRFESMFLTVVLGFCPCVVKISHRASLRFHPSMSSLPNVNPRLRSLTDRVFTVIIPFVTLLRQKSFLFFSEQIQGDMFFLYGPPNQWNRLQSLEAKYHLQSGLGKMSLTSIQSPPMLRFDKEFPFFVSRGIFGPETKYG